MSMAVLILAGLEGIVGGVVERGMVGVDGGEVVEAVGGEGRQVMAIFALGCQRCN